MTLLLAAIFCMCAPGPTTGPYQPAERGTQTQLETPPIVVDTAPPPVPGLWGQPHAPEHLDGCDEMNFYRVQWNLPAAFSGIGFRESNCRNEDGVRTSCCHGYWQMWTSLHLQDHRLAGRMAMCDVGSHHDLNSDTPADKQRQACAAKMLYDVVGTSPWSATR